jgi:hypothetical protein
MTATVVPTMVVEDVEPRTRPSLFSALHVHPMVCDHLWEPHPWETLRACCHRCGSLGHWVNDPRAGEDPT